jgi:hypothetical protein
MVNSSTLTFGTLVLERRDLVWRLPSRICSKDCWCCPDLRWPVRHLFDCRLRPLSLLRPVSLLCSSRYLLSAVVPCRPVIACSCCHGLLQRSRSRLFKKHLDDLWSVFLFLSKQFRFQRGSRAFFGSWFVLKYVAGTRCPFNFYATILYSMFHPFGHTNLIARTIQSCNERLRSRVRY